MPHLRDNAHVVRDHHRYGEHRACLALLDNLRMCVVTFTVPAGVSGGSCWRQKSDIELEDHKVVALSGKRRCIQYNQGAAACGYRTLAK